MKRLQVGIVLLAAAFFISLVMFNFTESVGEQYSSFREVEYNQTSTVIGQLSKNTLQYDSQKDLTTFWMIDEEGNNELVFYTGPPPASIMEAERLVITGHMEKQKVGKIFMAEHILMKCPSKYNDEI